MEVATSIHKTSRIVQFRVTIRAKQTAFLRSLHDYPPFAIRQRPKIQPQGFFAWLHMMKLQGSVIPVVTAFLTGSPTGSYIHESRIYAAGHAEVCYTQCTSLTDYENLLNRILLYFDMQLNSQDDPVS